MKGIFVYQPPGKVPQVPEFIDGLEAHLREKIILRLYQMSLPQKPEMKEPHFKHFSLERYRELCELRVKSKVLIRVIFHPCPNGEVRASLRICEAPKTRYDAGVGELS